MMNKFFYLLFIPFLTFGQSSLDEVELLFNNKQYSEAEKLIVQYLDENPNNLKSIELLGDAYGNQKKWDEAISEYKKLIDSDSNKDK